MGTLRTRPPGYLAVILVVVLVFGSPHYGSAGSGPAGGGMPGAAALDEQALALRPGVRESVDLSVFPSYRITAALDLDASTLQGSERVTFMNPGGQPLPDLVFRILPNATSIYGGGSLTVSRVSRGGAVVRWSLSQDRTVLTALLEPPLDPGETVELELSFAAEIPRSGTGYAIFSNSASVTSLAGWYPNLAPYRDGWQTPGIPAVGDANYFGASLYEVTLTAPATHAVVSTGITVDRRTDGASAVWRLISGPARGFALALSDRFQVQAVERDGVTIRYYALPAPSDARSPDAALQIAADAFMTYNRRFGPYPYTEFDVVETPVTVGGYEFAGMVFVEHSLRASADIGALRFIVAHETAHQWWYALVGSDPVTEPWLDEGLATYSAAIYAEDVLGAQAGRNMVNYFGSEGGSPSGVAPGIDVSALDYAGWVAYRGPVYYQAALFLDALRRQLADEAFFAMLRGYAQDHRFGVATTRDLLSAAERAAGYPLDELFVRWFGSADPGA